MKIELDISEIENGDDYYGPDLLTIIRDTVRTEAKKFVRDLVREELEKVAAPLRGVMAQRANALIEQISDEIRAMPDERVADALLDMVTKPNG